MKQIVQTLIVAILVVLITGTFAFAAQAAASAGTFPYFHIGCLIMGGLTITSLKYRYPAIYLSEAIGSFALYTILVALFTSPVIDILKEIIS